MRQVKFLCIAILGIVVVNAECAQQTVFDLPNNTPGLRINIQNKVVNNTQNQRCLHIIVPETEAAAANDVMNAMNLDGNIYFPADGSQPTTHEAVKYSCANVDNSPSSPITEWYMKMFGVIPFRNVDRPGVDDYIKAGYDNSNTTYRIIDTSNLLTKDANGEFPRNYSHQRDAFEKNFRKIASTYVGRVLLYRLLIEIRRHANTFKKPGCLEASINCSISIDSRNDCRHLMISWRPSGNSFSFTQKTINFGIQYPTKKITTIGPIEDNDYHKIILYPRSDDVGLFHEMIHWYHSLRHIGRYSLERNANNGKIKIDGIDGIDNNSKTNINIGSYYWSQETSDKWKFSAMPWIVANTRESFAVGFEEIRTILGSDTNVANYMNGDDISENLYRLCNKQPLRFGHSSSPFYEDKNVIEKVLSVCRNSMRQYSSNTVYQCIVENPQSEDCPKFEYTSTVLRSGIGYCKYPHIGIELIKP